MGLFSDLLKAVADGSVEKTLAGVVDKLESGLDKVVETAEGAAAQVEEHGQKIDAAAEKLQQ